MSLRSPFTRSSAIRYRARSCARSRRIPAPHVNRGMLEAFDEEFGGVVAVSAIAVHERVDLHESVVEADGQLVGLEGIGLDPEPGIVDELLHQGRHLVPVDAADVHIVPAVPACPTPDLVEHGPVAVAEVPVVEQLGDRR